ncbi:hypothetical protein pdam_00006969 [Pocillopora damicornis]|uniref:Uncharacterized protein n=1 Tax=Pocillopora damicornis TaxID=46731 RepID=A0A3M6UUY0_POCDA|nr:hypothetical protein pdam_00006969 [Pocillopora damicornis]
MISFSLLSFYAPQKRNLLLRLLKICYRSVIDRCS